MIKSKKEKKYSRIGAVARNYGVQNFFSHFLSSFRVTTPIQNQRLWKNHPPLPYWALHNSFFRTGDKNDGCVIFYKRRIFKLDTDSKIEYFKSGDNLLDRYFFILSRNFHHRKYKMRAGKNILMVYKCSFVFEGHILIIRRKILYYIIIWALLHMAGKALNA